LKYTAFALALLLTGCASSGVVPLTADIFVISKNTAKFGGGISTSAAAEVHEEANDFCTKQGKKSETVDLQLLPGRAGSMGSVTLQFRCI
jgi:predicted outer membrane repeat protein